MEHFCFCRERTRSLDPLAPERWTCPWSPTAYGTSRACGRRATCSTHPEVAGAPSRYKMRRCTRVLCSAKVGKERKEAGLAGTSCVAPAADDVQAELTFGPSFCFFCCFFFKQEAAVMKTGVAGRINEWLNKTPESGKTSGGRPAVGRQRMRLM